MSWILGWVLLAVGLTLLISLAAGKLKKISIHGVVQPRELDVKAAIETAFPIYTVLEVMETLPDSTRDGLRLHDHPCPGYGRQVQGHLWTNVVLADQGRYGRWKCRLCREVCRTTEVAASTGTFYSEDDAEPGLAETDLRAIVNTTETLFAEGGIITSYDDSGDMITISRPRPKYPRPGVSMQDLQPIASYVSVAVGHHPHCDYPISPYGCTCPEGFPYAL